MAFISTAWRQNNTKPVPIGGPSLPNTLPGLLLVLTLLLAGAPRTGAETLRNLNNGICLDTSTGLMWQIGHSRRFGDADKVRQYLAGLKLGGFTDWRLPTTLETKGLRLLIDIHGNNSCGIEKPRKRYWMLENKEGMIPIRLELESFCRGIYSRSVGARGYVRAVRNAGK